MFFGNKWKAGLNIWWGIVHYFIDLPVVLIKREATQKLRVKSDKELFKVIMKNPGLDYYIKRVINYWKTGIHG